jgi:hypothetical protein
MDHDTTRMLSAYIRNIDKFDDCVGTIWSNEKKQTVLNRIQKIEILDNIKTFTQLIRS